MCYIITTEFYLHLLNENELQLNESRMHWSKLISDFFQKIELINNLTIGLIHEINH